MHDIAESQYKHGFRLCYIDIAEGFSHSHQYNARHEGFIDISDVPIYFYQTDMLEKPNKK